MAPIPSLSNATAVEADGTVPPVDRSVGLKLLLKIHWMSSAVCLLGMLLFSVTGITLNHAGQIEAAPAITRQTLELPPALTTLLQEQAEALDGQEAALPEPALQWGRAMLGANLAGRQAEWAKDEIYLALPRPGGDAWLRFVPGDGVAEYEATDRGWVSWLNDVHKGRHTGPVWFWFIDVFALACLLFSLSGLWILKIHAIRRPGTWPLVGAGMLGPLLILLLFVH